MAKMWTSNEGFDIETARDYASKLVLLASAHRAGIFEALSEEKDIEALKQALNADERALFIVLEALCALGYAHKRLDRYIISDQARSLFLERGKDYVGGSLPHFLDIMEAWLKLPGIIKGAKPDRSERDVGAFMNAMASRPDKVVEETVELCLKRKSNAKNVLDLGGGPGKYSKAFVNRGVKAVLYDLPDTIDYVKTHFNLGDVRNLTLKKGDFTNEFVKEFSGESFDIVFMGNVCHIYSEKGNRKIIKQASSIMRSTGMIAIEDMVRGRSPMAEMFAVNMLANTEDGSTYTEAQYREWLTDAGFRKIEIIDLVQKSNQLITAFLG
ncbi:MAG TPA: methyltransferase [Candidatus Methanoperedens sp.]|nr:methyltransferase [Candidatus Methanoperedens sp.]